MRLLAGAVPALKAAQGFTGQQTGQGNESAPFKATRESLKAYRIPDWYRDAKFGIWAHWGPQSAAEYGDWYARGMYLEGEWQYKHHVETYGHPSKFGFKDVIETWKADKFDPDYLVGLYKRAGAKYFVSMGVHHDNFCLWNCKYTRWNSVRMGPKKDIVGLFRKAALRNGLRFGVTEHLWITYKWFSVSHGADKLGPYAGVPYDGANRSYADLYLDCPKIYKDLPWDEEGIPESWKQTWYLRVKDLVDQHQPDFLYSDGSLPFQQWGLDLLAHYYNQNARQHHGKVEGVYTSKHPDDCAVGTCALDVERGVVQDIWPNPWQTDTCIGNWHYQKGATYKSPKIIIDLLVDVVSRNGNLLLNFPLPNNGMLDAEELKILDEITKWMTTNGSAIYATRPWKMYGTGPSTQAASADAKFNENKRKELTAGDVRFTTKGQTLYAFIMGWPEKPPVIEPLATKSKHFAGRVRNVELLGYQGKLKWSQDESGLKVQLPPEKPGSYAFALKIDGLDLQKRI